MHLLRRNAHHDDPDLEDENDAIDPELRLRTVRTAHSTIEESIRTEERAMRRKTMLKKRGFFRRGTDKKRVKDPVISETTSESNAAPPVHGLRRNIYVNMPLPQDELDSHGEPIVRYVRNKVRTSSECTCSLLAYVYLPLFRIHHRHVHSKKPLRAISQVSVFGRRVPGH